ncbi:MAG: ATP-binding cassette domain-containing protein [Sphaerochaetaceae bacterium]
MISVLNAKKAYTEKVKIGPLSAQIPKAGITSLIGPNGAGKSTMLLMIGRLLDIDEGQIDVAKMNICSANSESLARILTKEDEKIISKYIDLLGLKELENRYLEELSGGQRQRAYVAMVLSQETEYVLLDEPLNNLDVARSVQMMEHLRCVADEFGKTILTVMHDINFATKYSNRIYAMKEGKIAASGSVEQIMNSKLLTTIFETKIEIIHGPHGPIAVY